MDAAGKAETKELQQGVAKVTVLGNLELSAESFADAAFGWTPSDDVNAWRQSNRAERNKLIGSYHAWQAKMRANFPKTYQVSNAIAQSAAPAAQISKLALVTIAGVSLAIESGGAFTGVALDMIVASADESIGMFAIGESASISGATVTPAAVAVDLSIRDLADSAKPGVSSTTGAVSKVGVFAGSERIRSSSLNLPEDSESNKVLGYRVSRALPKTSDGVPIPDSSRPHSQVGERASRRAGSYRQVLTWGYDEKGDLVPKKIIDFTDHGRPTNHASPHQHRYLMNSTGGSLSRGPAEPLSMSDLALDELLPQDEPIVESEYVLGGPR